MSRIVNARVTCCLHTKDVQEPDSYRLKDFMVFRAVAEVG
jgi:hypothetical protein